ncbi:hypothetical protein OIE69_00950 [Actinacidiphila glaucinigra]|uniref:Ku protein n=1 Tax=Actinacidiphila glaucinigra TaxID=235986 RepID=UPI002DD7B3DB|nr:Ku protein [Actinacidiphila glaucinigra]WSD57606.1 hypothetical protein OIE69_00950 [Actinacidiphila glaucinigra]
MRAIWTGYVSFGLVTIPVRLYSGTEEHGAGFHQIHARDSSAIRHQRVRESEDVEVSQSEIARGLERPDGRAVVLRDEDLAALALPTKRTVDVLGFVDERGVDPVLYSRPLGWGGAAGEQDQRPYALLVEALAQRARSIDREPVPAFAPPFIRPGDRTPSGSLPRNTRRRSPRPTARTRVPS